MFLVKYFTCKIFYVWKYTTSKQSVNVKKLVKSHWIKKFLKQPYLLVQSAFSEKRQIEN